MAEEAEAAVIKFLRRVKGASVEEIEAVTDVTDQTLETTLAKMKQDELVRIQGEGKSKRFVVATDHLLKKK